MHILDALAACAGDWRGTNTLEDPEGREPEDSAAGAMVCPVPGGRFVRLDYTWSYHRTPREGSLLTGFDSAAEAVTAQWIDTWHMGDKVMRAAAARRQPGPS